MSTIISIGYSLNHDPLTACKEAAIQAKTTLPQGTADFVFMLFTDDYLKQESLSTIQRILQPKHLIGSNTSGIILSDQIITRGIAVLAIHSTDITFHSALSQQDSLLPSYTVGHAFARTLTENHHIQNRKAAIILSNIINQNHHHFSQSLLEGFGYSLPIIGGCSCYQFNTSEPLQCYRDAITTRSTLGVLLSNNVSVVTEASHGFIPLGKPHLITSSERNIIHTIDNAPATALYKYYFNDKISHENSFSIEKLASYYPLGISSSINNSQYTIHQPIQLLSSGSLLCQSEIPTNYRVQLMIAKENLLKQSTATMANTLKNKLQNIPPQLLLVFASQTRQKVLHQSAHDEIKIIKNTFGLTTPIFGMYTCGEIISQQNKLIFENAHLSLTAIL